MSLWNMFFYGRKLPECNIIIPFCFSAAVDFLEDRFSGRHPKLKALTSKGTELDTIAFRNEEFSPDRVS